MKHENKMIYRVTLTAVFAALVFVSSMISVPIPVAIGDVTRIHLGNIFCLLSGFVLGPVGGGLAAGLGSALYDMTNPAYIASAPFTFVFKFLLAAVCGWAAYARGSRAENHGQNILAAIAGSATYMVLYWKSWAIAFLKAPCVAWDFFSTRSFLKNHRRVHKPSHPFHIAGG